MNKLKRILVATDFSEQSQFAMLRAVELAEKTKAHLTILHIAKKQFLEKMLEDVVPIVGKVLITPEEYATALLKKEIEKLTKNKNKINIKYSIISGDRPAVKILKFAKDHQFDLLVVGAHGKYSIHDWFVGTTAEYIAKKTQLPVLIVKKPAHKAYRKILVPTDFSANSKYTVQFAAQLFTKTDFRLLHVGDHEYDELLKQEEESPKEKIKKIREAILFLLKEKMQKFIKSCGKPLAKSPYDIKVGYPSFVIIDEAKKRNQDLVIMGTQGHGQRHYLFIGRVASKVMIEIDRDILLVPPKKKNR